MTKKKLEEIIETSRWDRVSDYVQSSVNLLLRYWFSFEHDKLDDLLQQYTYELERVEDKYGYNVSIDYHIGQLSGSISLIKELLLAEKQSIGMIDSLVKSSKKASEILDYLYHTGQKGMRHRELAEAIGSSPSSLTSIMKKIILSGAVDVSRSGPSTHYLLSDAGRRFVEQLVKKKMPNLEAYEWFAARESEITELTQELRHAREEIEKLSTMINENENHVLRQGDSFYSIIDGHPKKFMQIYKLFRMDDIVYAQLDSVFDSVDPSVGLDSFSNPLFKNISSVCKANPELFERRGA